MSSTAGTSPQPVRGHDITGLPRRLALFLASVLLAFRRNQGMLLSGAVAYYSLLSIVPLVIVTLIGLSHFMDEELLFQMVSSYLEMMVPGYAETLTAHVQEFLKHREVVGIVGFVVMLFFSSIAFTVLESAMSVIFFRRVRTRRRHFLVSAVIPYVYIVLLGAGLLLVSFIAGALETLENRQLAIFKWTVSFEGTTVTALYLLGLTGEVLMLTSLYLVMPVGRITFRHALIGGITATILWEITRRVLVWYYETLSFVNLIYGSLATAIISLLTIEVAVMILLLGAQVIAELERTRGDSSDNKEAYLKRETTLS
ncbi:MAG TPA: YihY/virulence factor BrkB family protein [Dissulfurispiraceae bacterium]|nr:YihY/virulence factor BrkB family protein [Dissulfurispiraceae bacterium]